MTVPVPVPESLTYDDLPTIIQLAHHQGSPRWEDAAQYLSDCLNAGEIAVYWTVGKAWAFCKGETVLYVTRESIYLRGRE